MERFDQEVWYNILLNSSLEDVLKQCQINKRVSSVCKSNHFWTDYLYKNWNVKFNGNNREAVIKAERLLQIMKEEEQIMTVDCFWSIVEFIPESKYKDLLNGFGGVVSFPTISENISNFDLNKYYNLNIQLPPVRMGTGSLTPREKEFIGKMLTIIDEPTNYILDKKKIISYPYNIDYDVYILNLLQANNPMLYEYLNELTEKKGRKVYEDLYINI